MWPSRLSIKIVLDRKGVQIMEMGFQRFNLGQSLTLANDKCLKEVAL